MTSLLPEAVTALPGAAAAAVLWRHRRQLQVTVVAKATFAFAPDADMPVVEPQPVVRAEVHHGNLPARSVALTSDLAPHLARADIVFTGHACAPPGAPARALRVRVGVFDRDRARLDKSLTVQDPAGFERVPMTYERAFGGIGVLDNPFGTGAAAGSAAPSVVDPAQPQRGAGFAPLGRAYPLRKRLLGATPRAQLDGDVAEIPDDFDWGYYQAAPPDQRTDPLSGGEWIVLEGLHPTLPRLRTRLPGARGLARVHGLARFGVAEGQTLELVADTLRIDGDAQRCTVVWRRSFPVYADEALAELRIVAGVEVAGAALRWTEPPPRASTPPDAFAGTMVLTEAQVHAVTLPFRGDASHLAQASPQRKAPRKAADATFALTPEQDHHAASKGALPFEQTVVRPPASAAAAPRSALPFDDVAASGPKSWPSAPPAIAEPPVAEVKKDPEASPWAPAPPPSAPSAPRPPPPPAAQPAASPSLKKGLYRKFGGGR